MSIAAIRVLVVDDDPFVRASLATILSAQSDIDVCGDGANGNEAVTRYSELLPDILLMDIQMPKMTGIEAAKVILGAQPTARIVFLTTFSDDEYIVSALRLGAKGYLIKEEVANIAPALRSVMAGQMVLGKEVLSKVDVFLNAAPLFSASRHNPAVATNRDAVLSNGLTERELEIIELIAQGFDNKEIAARVYISEGTVRNHVSAILQKLQFKNRTQLAVYYYRGCQ